MSANMNQTRNQITHDILTSKACSGKKWSDLAILLDRSKEWTVAACLGQMKMSEEQARIVQKFFDLSNPLAIVGLSSVPYKNQQMTTSDPLLYRMHEVRNLKKKKKSCFSNSNKKHKKKKKNTVN